MHFHRSNRAERLIDGLAQLVGRPNADPFAQETVVVQSRGMERWVAMELSRRLGVWANGRFPFPRTWIDDVTARVLNAPSDLATRFSPEAMQWSIAAVLPTLLDRAELRTVRSYVGGDEQARRLLELSAEVARVLDQYVVFRPKLVAEWERGHDDNWQAVVWRALVQRHGAEHAAARAQRLLKALSTTSKLAVGVLPERVSLFAISTLPPLYVEMLSQLARHMEVHWFLLSPSREYWADIRPQREIWSALSRDQIGTADADELHLTEGQPLLAAWGRTGRDLIRVVDQRVQQLDAEHDDYVDPGTDSLLHVLQSDMLHLRDRHAGGEHGPRTLAESDQSLTIHACHSEMREVQVLQDQLIALLEADPTLQPQDILVMAPDIDRYAPLIDAVFARGDDLHALPYAISDRRAAISRPTLDAFATLLDALGSRMTASTVLDLLNIDLVREQLAIEAEDVERIVDWVTESGARWGVDEHHRVEVGQPERRENTWRFGLDRLLLGYALDGEGEALAFGVRPLDDVEGTETELLGRFVDFCERLFAFRERVRGERAMAQWRDLLAELLATMLKRSAINAADHRTLLETLDQLAMLADKAGFDRGVSLATVQRVLADALERDGHSHGFLSSGITFCRMVPMRSIPFRVIALLGMNHDTFPRNDRDNGLDRSKDNRQPGDRSARDDDRQLLLEVVLSARDHLIVTFVGQSVQDNSVRPPSVLIDELLDWCTRAFVIKAKGSVTFPARDAMRRRLMVRHPLQPWSPDYFGAHADPRLFSYRAEHAVGSQALHDGTAHAHQLFTAPLPAMVASETIDLRELEETINDPVRTLLQQRLGIRLGRDAALLEDRGPMALEALESWQVATPWIDLAMKDRLGDDAFSLLRATGTIPLGGPGQAKADAVAQDARRIAQLSAPLRRQPIAPLLVDLPIGALRAQGLIRDRYAAGTVLATYSKLDSGQELRTWVRHLVINAVGETAGPRESHLVGRDERTGDPGVLTFTALDPEEARAHLQALLAVREEALQSPCPFDRKRGRAYAVHFCRHRNHEAAIEAVRGMRNQFGLGDYSVLAFDGVDPLDLPGQAARFARVAMAVYAPLLVCRGAA